jgi:CheY-like chemotaxis protein
MPGMNGAELAAACKKQRPDLPSLFVTGYADLGAIGSVGEERIVQKPFRGGELQRKVRHMLAGRDRMADKSVISAQAGIAGDHSPPS